MPSKYVRHYFSWMIDELTFTNKTHVSPVHTNLLSNNYSNTSRNSWYLMLLILVLVSNYSNESWDVCSVKSSVSRIDLAFPQF